MAGSWVRCGAERGTYTHVPRCPKAVEDSFVLENLIYHTRNLSVLSPQQAQLSDADLAETSAGKPVIRMKSDLSKSERCRVPGLVSPNSNKPNALPKQLNAIRGSICIVRKGRYS
jgi:hypothetical protein